MANGTIMYHNRSKYSCESPGACPRKGIQPGPLHHQRRSRRNDITVFEARGLNGTNVFMGQEIYLYILSPALSARIRVQPCIQREIWLCLLPGCAFVQRI